MTNDFSKATMETSMAKPVMTPTWFIDKVNRRLPKHHAYKSRMRVFLFPEGSTNATARGYDFEPAEARAVVSYVTKQVRSEFEIEPYLRPRSD